jgi:hypothetical protein
VRCASVHTKKSKGSETHTLRHLQAFSTRRIGWFCLKCCQSEHVGLTGVSKEEDSPRWGVFPGSPLSHSQTGGVGDPVCSVDVPTLPIESRSRCWPSSVASVL